MTNEELEAKYIENQNLIHFVINNFVQDKEKLNNLCSPEDLFQVGSIALCHAITTYNEKNGAFSTYATSVIKNRIYNELRDNLDQVYDYSVSLDDEVDTDFIENNVSIRYNNYQEVEDRIFQEMQKETMYKIAERYTGVAQKGVIAIHLMTKGYSCKKIAKIFQTDEKTLTAWTARARSKLKKEPEILKMLGKEP